MKIAANECQSQGYRQVTAAEACGYSVIELRIGGGDPTRAFYSPEGDLVGTWSVTDVLAEGALCSGEVPIDCVDWEGSSSMLVNKVDLCEVSDGGVDTSDAQ